MTCLRSVLVLLVFQLAFVTYTRAEESEAFGPKTYRPHIYGKLNQKDHFELPQTPYESASLTVKVGDGTEIALKPCKGRFLAKLFCKLHNSIALIRVKLERPREAQIIINNKVILSKKEYEPEKGFFTLPVAKQLLKPKNVIRVKLKGFFTSYLTLTLNLKSRPNQNPVARFSVNPKRGMETLTVTADASESSDSDGPIANYSWDFGDGNTAEGEVVTHHYTQPGEYQITLTVTDDKGATEQATDTVVVQVSPVEDLKISFRAFVKGENILFYEGDTVTLSNPGLTLRLSDTTSSSQTGVFPVESNWNIGGNLVQGKSVLESISSTGIVPISLNVKLNNGQVKTASATIIVNPFSNDCTDSAVANTCAGIEGIEGKSIPMGLSEFKIRTNDEFYFKGNIPQQSGLTVEIVEASDERHDITNHASVRDGDIYLAPSAIEAVLKNKSLPFSIEIQGADYDLGTYSISEIKGLLMGTATVKLTLESGEFPVQLMNEETGLLKSVILNTSAPTVLANMPPGAYFIRGEALGKVVVNSFVVKPEEVADLTVKPVEARGGILNNSVIDNNEPLSLRMMFEALDTPPDLGEEAAPAFGVACLEGFIPLNFSYKPLSYFPAPSGENVIENVTNSVGNTETSSHPGEYLAVSCLMAQPASAYPYMETLGHIKSRCEGFELHEVEQKILIGRDAILSGEFNRTATLNIRIFDEESPDMELVYEYQVNPKEFVEAHGGIDKFARYTGVGIKMYSGVIGNGYANPFNHKFGFIQVPTHYVKPKIEMNLSGAGSPYFLADNIYWHRPFYTCSLIRTVPQFQIKEITSHNPPSEKDAFLTDPKENAARSLKYLFPVDVDNASSNPFPKPYQAEYKISFESAKDLKEYKVYASALTGGAYHDISSAISLEVEEGKSEGILKIDVDTLDPIFEYKKDEDILEIEIVAEATRTTDQVHLYSQRYLLNFKRAYNLNSLGTCGSSYGQRYSAFGTANLVSALTDLGEAGLDFRCNDASLPFGGKFYVEPGFSHLGHKDGKNLDIRYFGSGTIPSCNIAPAYCGNYRDWYDGANAFNRKSDAAKLLGYLKEFYKLSPMDQSYCRETPLDEIRCAFIIDDVLTTFPIAEADRLVNWINDNREGMTKVSSSENTKRILISDGSFLGRKESIPTPHVELSGLPWQESMLVDGKIGSYRMLFFNDNLLKEIESCEEAQTCDFSNRKIQFKTDSIHYSHFHLEVK